MPRAVEFEKRIAAAIADPGVVDVSTSWTASLPKPMIELLKAGRKEQFDGYLSKVSDPATKANLSFRMRPYGFTSYFDTYKAVLEYNLTEVADRISCPMLVTEPANESFWPGQSRQLYNLLASRFHFPKVMARIFIANRKGPDCAIFGSSIGWMSNWGTQWSPGTALFWLDRGGAVAADLE